MNIDEMKTRMQSMVTVGDIKDKIRDLKHGQRFIWPESDYGRAELWRINDAIFLFSIPMYGGSPNFERAYECTGDYVNRIYDNVESWT